MLSLIAALALIVAAVILLRPAPRFAPQPVMLEQDLDAMLAAQEQGIAPELAARIIWAGRPDVPTPVAIVYLHGFSASPEEIRPVPDQVAQALGANLYFARLGGHGQGAAAMGEASVAGWAQDVAQAVAMGRALGERVVVIGTSTGATLAALAARDPQIGGEIDAVVMLSPNFALQNRAAPLLTLPLARHWLPLIAGRERCFETRSDDHARFWTPCYPTRALIPMAELVRLSAQGDYAEATQPLLILADPRDRVVDPQAAQPVAATWGGPVTLTEITTPEGDDPDHHVIAGRIMSPQNTPAITAEITNWLREVLRP
ncbi:MAG: alpha/beta hydrolase [Paracoccus sp. (in: a-proteobacteria)]|nr:alpha/beta hydrolase [Paracoccus sp. (in: a-proteobacteria)]